MESARLDHTGINHSQKNVIVEVLADSREIDDSGDVDALEKGGIADARNLKNLGGVERASGKNDLLIGVGGLNLSALASRELRDVSVLFSAGRCTTKSLLQHRWP